jgi:hypothetical protein
LKPHRDASVASDFCSSCCGRRMAALAAHLIDDVLGGPPVRQWVLTLPHRLRYAMAFDHKLCRAVWVCSFARSSPSSDEARGVVAFRVGSAVR